MVSARTRPWGWLLAGAVTVAIAVPTVASTSAPEPAVVAEPEREWTIIYYGLADNNLETALLGDVLEMSSVDFGPEVALYGLLDRSGTNFGGVLTQLGPVEDAAMPSLGTFDGAKAFVATGGQLVEMADLGEIDMGQPETLAWFVAEVMRVAPAKKTALIMADHGFGPLGIGPDENVLADGSAAADISSIDGRELARALGLGLRGTKLDVIAFDACLMGNLETGRFLTPYADYMVAAEDVIPGNGYDYVSLAGLAAQPQMSGLDLGKLLVDSFGSYYTDIEPTEGTTLALFDLGAIGRLEAATKSLALALDTNDAGPLFGTAVAASDAQITLDPDGGWFIDLGDLTRRLAQPGGPDAVRIAADSVFNAVGNVIVHQFRGYGRADATGISITHFPSQALAVNRTQLAPYWNDWMQRYYGSATPLPDSVGEVWTTSEATLTTSSSGVVVSADLRPEITAAGSLVGAVALFGTPGGGGDIEIAVRYPAIVNSGAANRVAASWGLSSFVLASGSTVVRPTVELEKNSELLIGRVAGRRVATDGTSNRALLRFSVDPTTGAPGAPVLYTQVDSTGAWAEAAPSPGDSFIAEVQVLSGDGTEITTVPASALPIDALEIRPNRQTTGDVAAALGALGVDGTITAISAAGRLG